MKKVLWIIVIAGAMLLSIVASVFAGGGHACTASMEDCAKKMHAKYSSAGWLGVETEKGEHGYSVISAVVAGSPADVAGFESGDVLVAINGVALLDDNKDKIKKVKTQLAPGSKVIYTVKRKGGKLDLTAQLGQMPESVIARSVGEHILHDHLQVTIASK